MSHENNDRPGTLVRIEEAGLGTEAQVRLWVRGVSDPKRLRSTWASSGASVERVDDRLHATTTVEALSRAAGRCLPPEESAEIDRGLRSAVAAWRGPTPAVRLASGILPTDVRTLVMGIVNVTPDSFSDGGALYPPGDGNEHPDAAIAFAQRLVDEGADLVDVGGESTRPGADPVSQDEELARVLPVVRALAGAGIVVSIDTTKSAVARAALDAGAVLVNDTSGARDPELLEVVAEKGAGYVLMHARGVPKTMATQAQYRDVVDEVYTFLARGIERCAGAGIDPDHLIVDPGLGFAKACEHNLALLRGLRQFRGFGRPVAVGASRKSFLGQLLDDAPVDERFEGSLACAVLAVASGAALIRVHDVGPTVRAIRVARAVDTGRLDWPSAQPVRTG